MNRQLSLAAFAAGLLVIGWVGSGYVGSNLLALAMTALIAVFYLMGAQELRRFHQATAGLRQALAAIPEQLPHLGPWLDQLHPSLQNPVRLRIESERGGLPGPALTPYLVGLLVILGMLGTFLGMVVTLKGAVLALESTTDLATIRAALAAPVKGLGLAFGTSVAGVAASAMLGLMAALCRRDRLQAAQLLDTSIATRLRSFSLAHQRQETLKTLQDQAAAMPAVVDKLQAMMLQMERHSLDLNTRMLAGQDSFHRSAQAAYTDLAKAVDRSLQQSLTDSARIAGATIQPVVEATMAGIARETTALQQQMADTVQAQLDGVSARFGSVVASVTDTWTTALAQHERRSEDLSGAMQQSLSAVSATLAQQSASLLDQVAASHVTAQAALAAQDGQRQAALTQSLESMALALQQAWQQAGAQALGQQERICQTLEQTARDMQARAETHAGNTIAEVARLMQAAAEAPRAAAEMVGLLRQKLSDSLAHDNDLLEERSRIMGTLQGLLDVVHQASTEQRQAIETLVGTSSAVLQQVGAQFSAQVDAESTRLTAAAAQVGGSAIDVASMAESFGFAVQLFSSSNEALVAHLQRIEAALDKSSTRSDEQLAYYVAQAREIIDLSISSQKQIVDNLQQLSSRQAPLATEVA